MEVLRLEHVEKTYGANDNEVKAVRDVSFQIQEKEFTAIVGTSGSGKSTLLNLIGGLDKPTKGKIIVKGNEIHHFIRKEMTLFRRRNIGFVFQNYSLMPVLNVYDNVALPMMFDKKRNKRKNDIEMLLQELGLWEKRKKYPDELSGGQQQRVAIARALANHPAILLADEPTGNLDSNTTNEVIELLKNCARRYKQTVLMVTHNDFLARQCDRIIRVEDGKIAKNLVRKESLC
ncbi:MAG: ABC transporter ATP-binding protein [Eubacterium sp.]|nr:ABC transporter ATP-binding protein [Eubacterium sp.]